MCVLVVAVDDVDDDDDDYDDSTGLFDRFVRLLFNAESGPITIRNSIIYACDGIETTNEY